MALGKACTSMIVVTHTYTHLPKRDLPILSSKNNRTLCIDLRSRPWQILWIIVEADAHAICSPIHRQTPRSLWWSVANTTADTLLPSFYYLSYKMMGLQADRVPDMSDVMTRLGNLEARVGEKLCSALLQWASSCKFALLFTQPGRTDPLLGND